MALTRKFLTAMGIEDDKVDEIISAHSDTVNALKEQRDNYKEDAEKLQNVQKELDELKAQATTEDPYKEKYEELQKQFEDYKNGIAEEKMTAKKTDAFRGLLKEAKISDAWVDDIVNFNRASLGDIQFDDEGKIVDADKRIEDIKSKYGKYVEKETQVGAEVKNPPQSTGGATMTKEEIRGMNPKDRQAIQKAMLENGSLFGLE